MGSEGDFIEGGEGRLGGVGGCGCRICGDLETKVGVWWVAEGECYGFRLGGCGCGCGCGRGGS